MSMSFKSAVVAAGIAMVALTSAVGGAQAGGKQFKFKNNFHHRPLFLHSPVFVGDSCFFYKKMWWKTGHFVWKQKYYICMGWW